MALCIIQVSSASEEKMSFGGESLFVSAIAQHKVKYST
jgi:hypothetical protein